MMNEGDPQIEYRAVPVVSFDSVDQVKSLPLTYDEFRVLVAILLRERDFHLSKLPGALEADAVTGVLKLDYVQGILLKLGYSSDQVDDDQLADWDMCMACNGTGVQDGETCRQCGGQGFVIDLENGQ